MDTTDMRTTLAEDRQGIALLKRVLHIAYDAGIEEWSEDDAYDEAVLWDDLLAVIGAST